MNEQYYNGMPMPFFTPFGFQEDYSTISNNPTPQLKNKMLGLYKQSFNNQQFRNNENDYHNGFMGGSITPPVNLTKLPSNGKMSVPGDMGSILKGQAANIGSILGSEGLGSLTSILGGAGMGVDPISLGVSAYMKVLGVAQKDDMKAPSNYSQQTNKFDEGGIYKEGIDFMLNQLNNQDSIENMVASPSNNGNVAVLPELPIPQNPVQNIRIERNMNIEPNYAVNNFSELARTKAGRQEAYNLIYNKAQQLGDPHPEITAAQWALESGWGKHTSGKHNYFGVKGKGTVVSTNEYTKDGKKYNIKDSFRDYNSLEESLADNIKLKTTSKYYAGYKEKGLAALGNYATDPNYANLLNSIIKQYKKS